MGYITGTLATSETLVAQARFHWLYHLAAWTVIGAGLLGALYALSTYRSVWLAAAFLSLAAYGLVRLLIPLLTTEIGVTDHRLIVKTGLLARHTSEMQLFAIEAVSLDQGVPGRLLGFGRINVQGTGDDALSLPVIAAPLEFRTAMENAIAKAQKLRQPANAS